MSKDGRLKAALKRAGVRSVNKAKRTPSHPKKSHVVVAKKGDKIKLIHFGATGYGHNYSAAARKSFRARHKCDTASDILTARYWACRTLWGGAGKPKQSSPKSRKGKY